MAQNRNVKIPTFTVAQIVAMKNLPEDLLADTGKVIIVTTVDCDKRCADILNVQGSNMIDTKIIKVFNKISNKKLSIFILF